MDDAEARLAQAARLLDVCRELVSTVSPERLLHRIVEAGPAN